MRRELRFGLLGTPVLYGERSGEGTCSARPGVRAVGSPKLRTLLATLLLDAGRVVSVDGLKDALWGGTLPVSAQPSLHNHVARLRRLLDDPGRLVTVPTGYLLRADDGELDVHRFDSLVASARTAHTGRDWERVVRCCVDALALWRGAPLAGLSPEVGGYALIRRVQEARLLLLECRYDAELALLGGRPAAGLVPELAALAAEHPLREAYHRQLMLALHRTGRRAEALAVHRDLRTRLAEELGIEPGPGVREAHVEVLRGADEPVPGQRPRRRVPAGGPGASPVVLRPAQLPAAPVHFTGRGEVGDELRRALTSGARPTIAAAPGPGSSGSSRALGSPASSVVVISGMAGVGKSALALHVAQGLTERFCNGQLYVNLHGATPGRAPLTSAQALGTLLRDLGIAPRDVPERQEAAAALLRSLLAPTRTLLVLDDAANAAQVRPLLPAGPGCAVIVTSRSPLTALDGAARFPLAPLTGEDSAALLRAVSGRDDLDAGHPLITLTGRLPLALRVVAVRPAARGALTPDALAGRLAAADSRLAQLEYDDLSVRRSLAVAHDGLAASGRETDRDAALVLRRIGALDLPGYRAARLARLAGIDVRRAEAALDRLVEVSLLEETAYGCYAPHDLVRDFARELARESARGPASGPTPVSGPLPVSEPAPTLLPVPESASVSEPAPTLLPECAGESGLRGHLASA
ncbi:AfsR/SARP family transcriptional regulator [Streptomyces hirsutus]|uniref:AfsR/SARP family transcriptional regulator n=1 Tax=Streptomyces hirsutus TaxID=35620 RepID=UPI0036A1C35B